MRAINGWSFDTVRTDTGEALARPSWAGRWSEYLGPAYNGTLVDTDINLVWRCGHDHQCRQEAVECAEAEFARRRVQ